jgi:hypothetical protein
MDTNNYKNFEEWKNQKMDEIKYNTMKQIDDAKEKGEPYQHLIMLLNQSLQNIEAMGSWYEQNKHLF